MESVFYTSDSEDENEKAVPGNWDNVVCDYVSATVNFPTHSRAKV
jgi:hypothetical protein